MWRQQVGLFDFCCAASPPIHVTRLPDPSSPPAFPSAIAFVQDTSDKPRSLRFGSDITLHHKTPKKTLMEIEHTPQAWSRMTDVFLASGVQQVPEFPTYAAVQAAPCGLRFFDSGLLYDFEDDAWMGNIKNQSCSQDGVCTKSIEIELTQGLPLSIKQPLVGLEALEPLTAFASRWFQQDPSLYVSDDLSVHYHVKTHVELVFYVKQDLPTHRWAPDLFE